MYKITTLHTVDYAPTVNAVRAWAEDYFGSEIDVDIPDLPLLTGQKFQVGFTVECVPDAEYYSITTPEEFSAVKLVDGTVIAAGSDDGFDIGRIEYGDNGAIRVTWLGAAGTMDYQSPAGFLPCRWFPSVDAAKAFGAWTQ